MGWSHYLHISFRERGPILYITYPIGPDTKSSDTELARIVLFYSMKRFKLEIHRVGLLLDAEGDEDSKNRRVISYYIYYFLKNKNLL